jgi:hypothetical protein
LKSQIVISSNRFGVTNCDAQTTSPKEKGHLPLTTNMLSILTTKTESLYCAFSPEMAIVSYGACRDEALNNLQDEIRMNQLEAKSKTGNERNA